MIQAQLIIYIHDDDLVSSVVLDRNGSVVDKKHHVALEEIATLADANSFKQVWVFIPTRDVLLTVATLPKMSRTRALQAIPYALEDQLIQDVDALHFALSPTRSKETQAVAVIAKDLLQQWLIKLKTHGIQPNKISATVFALPYVENVFQVFLLEQSALVRTDQFHGYECERINLMTLLAFSVEKASVKPEQIVIYNFTSTPIAVPSLNEVPIIERSFDHDDLIMEVAAHAGSNESINLLQGLFNSKPNRNQISSSVLKAAAGLISASLLILVIAPFVSASLLNSEAQRLNTQIAAIYHKHFPNATSVIAPKERMEGKLHNNGEENKEGLLTLLAKVGVAVAAYSDVKIKNLDFNNNQLTLNVIAESSDVFNRFIEELNQNGAHVHQRNANLQGKKVIASLQIE